MVGSAVAFTLTTVSACGSCGENGKEPGAGEAKAENSAEPSSIRPFRVRWDGGRRLRPHRRAPGGDTLFVEDAGSTEHDL